MNRRASNYETLYGVGLLDDLHNYFPALLYDSDSFRTVQDVLGYISLQTRRRFDLYSFGLSAYEEENSEERPAYGGAGNSTMNARQFYAPPARNAREIPTSPPPPTTTPASPSTANLPRTATAATAANQGLYRYVIDLGDEQFDIGEHMLPNIPSNMSVPMMTTLLTGLQSGFQSRTNARTNEVNTIANILLRLAGETRPLEPVVVRPTLEQIQRATEVATPDTNEHDCAICQDSITTSQQCRKILHCGHWFHKDCIDPWFRQNVQCPICRYDIRDYRVSPEASTTAQPPRTSYPEEDYH